MSGKCSSAATYCLDVVIIELRDYFAPVHDSYIIVDKQVVQISVVLREVLPILC